MEWVKEEVMLERDYFSSGRPISAPRLCSQSVVLGRAQLASPATFRMQAWGWRKAWFVSLSQRTNEKKGCSKQCRPWIKCKITAVETDGFGHQTIMVQVLVLTRSSCKTRERFNLMVPWAPDSSAVKQGDDTRVRVTVMFGDSCDTCNVKTVPLSARILTHTEHYW